MSMDQPDSGSFSPSTTFPDDSYKKIRKPYTITKSREIWTEQEHDKFLEALQLFDRDWKKIGAFVGSKTVIQIRSHAQKYFLKVQKNGTSAHVPPPRPKRKAAHPYPQKAPKNNSSPVLWNPTMISVTPACGNTTIPPADLLHVTEDDMREAGSSALNNCICNNQSSLRCHAGCEVAQHGNCGISLQVVPDFARIYSFIGSLFDPSTSGHLQKLKEMKPVDVETVVMMMSNLSINLLSPEFEVHKSLLSFYDAETQGAAPLPVVAAV